MQTFLTMLMMSQSQRLRGQSTKMLSKRVLRFLLDGRSNKPKTWLAGSRVWGVVSVKLTLTLN